MYLWIWHRAVLIHQILFNGNARNQNCKHILAWKVQWSVDQYKDMLSCKDISDEYSHGSSRSWVDMNKNVSFVLIFLQTRDFYFSISILTITIEHVLYDNIRICITAYSYKISEWCNKYPVVLTSAQTPFVHKNQPKTHHTKFTFSFECVSSQQYHWQTMLSISSHV